MNTKEPTVCPDCKADLSLPDVPPEWNNLIRPDSRTRATRVTVQDRMVGWRCPECGCGWSAEESP